MERIMKTKSFAIEAYKPCKHGALEHLCAQTKDAQMLHLTPEKIAAQTDRFVALNLGGKAVGYCAQTAWYPNRRVEVGSLIVDEGHRKQGIARQLVEIVTLAVLREDLQPIAFCNPESEGVYESLGYKPLPICNIPPQALELCAKCRKKPAGGGCCDKAYIYKGDAV